MIKQARLHPEPVLMIADLSLQSAVRSLAAEVRARFSRLDVFMNNAAAIFARRELTSLTCQSRPLLCAVTAPPTLDRKLRDPPVVEI